MVAVRPATPADRADIAATLASAFTHDPALGYIFTDAATRPKRLRRFFDLIAATERDPAQTDIACDADGAPAAVAVWRAPGAWQTPPLAMLRHAPAMVATFGRALPRALRLQAALEAHHPAAPHWYLEFLGCDLARQGKGYGGAAIRSRLARCDAAGEACALETANPKNVPLYASFGFAVITEYDVPRGGPHFWGMWREPR